MWLGRGEPSGKSLLRNPSPLNRACSILRRSSVSFTALHFYVPGKQRLGGRCCEAGWVGLWRGCSCCSSSARGPRRSMEVLYINSILYKHHIGQNSKKISVVTYDCTSKNRTPNSHIPSTSFDLTRFPPPLRLPPCSAAAPPPAPPAALCCPDARAPPPARQNRRTGPTGAAAAQGPRRDPPVRT